MRTKIILPRTNSEGEQYISFSQVAKWIHNRGDYYKSYFFGEKFVSNPYMDYGKRVGEALELGNYSSFSESDREVLERVPRLDKFETEVRYNFKEFHLLGYIDTHDKDFKTLIDYKTGGKDKIEVYKMEDYIQLHLYALAVKQMTGKLPEEIKVVHLERIGNPFKNIPFRLGNTITEIPLELSHERLQRASKIVREAAIDISNHYKAYNRLKKYNVKVEI